MIILDERIVAVFYIELPLNLGNWMCGITEIVPDQKYEVTYRFRYYNPETPQAFNSRDDKHWYSWTTKNLSRENTLTFVRTGAMMLAKVTDESQIIEVINDKGLSDFIQRFKAAPFSHMREATAEEKSELGLDKNRN